MKIDTKELKTSKDLKKLSYSNISAKKKKKKN
jgi:hypothetical protein